jgi:DNA-binding NarL/FixJ family response regulator
MMAEDHHVVRQAIKEFLAKESDITVVGEVAETRSLPDMVAHLQPDLLLLDARIPGPNIIEVTKKLCAQYPHMPILVLSAFDRREYVVGLLQAGANGYMLKDDKPEMLIQAIHSVAAGEEWLSPRISQVLLKSIRTDYKNSLCHLTAREMDVLRLMATGVNNNDIAETLMISIYTVKNHARNIFRKLGVRTRIEAVITAVNKNLIDPSA